MTVLPLSAIGFNESAIAAFARHAAAAYLTSLWVGLCFAAALVVCFHLFPSTTARFRFRVWTVVFVVLAALPLLYALLDHQPAGANSPTTTVQLQLNPRWSYLIAGLWFAAFIVRAADLALQVVRLHSLWRSAVPVGTDRLTGGEQRVSATWEATPSLGDLHRLSADLSRRIRLCTSARVDRPSVIGFFAPRILIPEWLFDQLTPGELHQVVLHELEHLRRRDDWINLLQKIGLVLFPLNPALFWIDRRLATERELACDDGVLSRTQAPRAYATCLTALAERDIEHRRHHRLSALAFGAVGAVRHSEFSRRIECILQWRPVLNPAPARALAALLIAAVLGAAALLARVPQLVTFNGASRQVATDAANIPAARADRLRAVPFPPAQFRDVVFHPPALSPVKASVRRTAKAKLKPAGFGNQRQATAIRPVQRTDRRWAVLASWQQSVPQPVLVTLPDGRIFLATYTAGPDARMDQTGWLLIQL